MQESLSGKTLGMLTVISAPSIEKFTYMGEDYTLRKKVLGSMQNGNEHNILFFRSDKTQEELLLYEMDDQLIYVRAGDQVHPIVIHPPDSHSPLN